MDATIQHEISHIWCGWESRCPEHIFLSMNEFVVIEYLEDPMKKGHWCIPFVYRHDSLPLRQASFKVFLEKIFRLENYGLNGVWKQGFICKCRKKETDNEYVKWNKKLVNELRWFYWWVRIEENVMKCMWVVGNG